MRTFSYILMLFGILTAGLAARDQFYVRQSSQERYILLDSQLVSNRNADDFRRALIIEWCCAGLILSSGVTLNIMVRKQDRLDPLSPDFDWKEEE